MADTIARPTSFAFGIRLGIFLMVEAASLSAIAVISLLGFVAYKNYKKYQARRKLRKWSQETMIPSDATDSSFFLHLMFAELIQAIGGLLNIKWIVDAFITEGTLCTAQGVLKQMGDVGVALMSLAIAFQTFSVLVFRWQAPPIVSKIVIGAIWLFIILVITIGAATHKNNYYGDTDYWCWIREEFKVERIVFEYLWMWLSAFIMLVLYGIIALVMRGILVVEDGVHWHTKKDHVKPDLSGAEEDDVYEKQSKAIANLMLFYPAIYIFCVFPVGLVRWLKFSGHDDIPPAATIFASILFSLSGLFNVILYKYTRPELVAGRSIELPSEAELYSDSYHMAHSTRGKKTGKSKHRHSHSYSHSEDLLRPVHKLGRLPERNVPGSLPEEESQGYFPHTAAPPLHTKSPEAEHGRLPDTGAHPAYGRLPDTDTGASSLGRLPDMDNAGTAYGRLPPSGNDLGLRPGSRDTSFSVISSRRQGSSEGTVVGGLPYGAAAPQHVSSERVW
ncbi:hypothetical protein BDQ12DRAFT_683986 [Crucibulum laeve]|uniref:Glucose receptor Git3 N-terminal domain-containing protein n=1 Tax=Crucibulum laeve TaxID=68775 RepID=A0A5C3LZX7_9AGAR|nr:hypothetical protein BDQ12DRAFT_683986 [Crucibulum laeve]